MIKNPIRAAVVAILMTAGPGVALASSEQQNLEELRQTVINLLQALVDQGVMSREKAAELVHQAQEKAAAAAAADAKRDEGAVRVPYVPQTVRDQISKQVADEVKPAVVEGVVQQAKAEGWGVPGAMPEWLSHVRVTGDVRVRGQADLYASDNVASQILDYNSINAGGGITKASANNTEFLNTTQSGERLRVRARLGAEIDLSPAWHAGVRLATGSATDPGSESQTLGTTAARYAVGFDQAYIRLEPKDFDGFSNVTASFGRFANPWLSPTELVWARDLTFEGVAATGRLSFGGTGDNLTRSHVFLTAGAFPVQYYGLDPTHSKWMLGAQLGTNLEMNDANTLRFAAGYYDFIRVQGVANNPSYYNTYNYTAPQFVRYGNSMYAISTVSATDSSVLLYGLAAKFRIADLAANYAHSFGRYEIGVNAEAVRNVGYSAADVLARTGQNIAARNKGYVADVGFGDPVADALGRWRTAIGYRYVQRDAVLDAWTDADFHEGGTNAAGFYWLGDVGVGAHTWVRLRYLSGNEIDGPVRYGVDIVQLDLNARF